MGELEYVAGGASSKWSDGWRWMIVAAAFLVGAGVGLGAGVLFTSSLKSVAIATVSFGVAGDAVNFASDMEKAKFFGKEGDEPNLCENIEKKW